MTIVAVNGARIAYTDTGAPPGDPDAATIVFGHGLLFSGTMFQASLCSMTSPKYPRGQFAKIRIAMVQWKRIATPSYRCGLCVAIMKPNPART